MLEYILKHRQQHIITLVTGVICAAACVLVVAGGLS